MRIARVRCVIKMIMLQYENISSKGNLLYLLEVKKAILVADKNALGTVCVGFTYFIIYLN